MAGFTTNVVDTTNSANAVPEFASNDCAAWLHSTVPTSLMLCESQYSNSDKPLQFKQTNETKTKERTVHTSQCLGQKRMAIPTCRSQGLARASDEKSPAPGALDHRTNTNRLVNKQIKQKKALLTARARWTKRCQRNRWAALGCRILMPRPLLRLPRFRLLPVHINSRQLLQKQRLRRRNRCGNRPFGKQLLATLQEPFRVRTHGMRQHVREKAFAQCWFARRAHIEKHVHFFVRLLRLEMRPLL